VGYLTYKGGKCTEHKPGLFFLYDGEAPDFRSDPPTFGALICVRSNDVFSISLPLYNYIDKGVIPGD